MPDVKSFFDEQTFTASYVVRDPASRHCVIIDPVLDFDLKSGRTSSASADDILQFIDANDFQVDWILETHAHADHLSAAAYLKERTGGRTAIGKLIDGVQEVFAEVFNLPPEFASDGSQFDHLFDDGETFLVGELEARVMHTPGHTPACLTYLFGDTAFIGDTLFMPDYGTARCDFPGGDARALYQSIQKILALPEETQLFLCHDYKAAGRVEFEWKTTVGEQRRQNVHIREGVTLEEFVTMRDERDHALEVPDLILPAVQVNIRAGAFPAPEENGVSYLKIPLNFL